MMEQAKMNRSPGGKRPWVICLDISATMLKGAAWKAANSALPHTSVQGSLAISRQLANGLNAQSGWPQCTVRIVHG
eukprot:566822-Pelagomonas_calceolata.AAC.6